ncbi:MAG: hypothetical protein J6C19_15970 [Lachnospiraceae bacterium]|nr:hypothetical protein [Lachnospiraceae bacterium]MBO5146998.1 hypothetical protein [Lachnospiraceae bacterium]
MILLLDGGYTSACDSKGCLESIRQNTDEEVISVTIKDAVDWNSVLRYLEDAGAIVLAADVHMNSVPACVLRFLQKVEQAVIDGESIGGKFYAVLYTALYEGEQTSAAMEILKNFCVHANITWGRGLGIGGNGIKTVAKGGLKGIFWKNASDFKMRSLQEHVMFIKERVQGEDEYVDPKRISRGGYVRRINHETKKNHRVKIAQN